MTLWPVEALSSSPFVPTPGRPGGNAGAKARMSRYIGEFLESEKDHFPLPFLWRCVYSAG